MIRPNRHTNPDYSVLNISAFVLNQLNAHYAISYDRLLNRVVDGLGNQAKENYPYALSLLFVLGKLNYQEENDSFTYNEDK